MADVRLEEADDSGTPTGLACAIFNVTDLPGSQLEPRGGLMHGAGIVRVDDKDHADAHIEHMEHLFLGHLQLL